MSERTWSADLDTKQRQEHVARWNLYVVALYDKFGGGTRRGCACHNCGSYVPPGLPYDAPEIYWLCPACVVVRDADTRFRKHLTEQNEVDGRALWLQRFNRRRTQTKDKQTNSKGAA